MLETRLPSLRFEFSDPKILVLCLMRYVFYAKEKISVEGKNAQVSLFIAVSFEVVFFFCFFLFFYV